MSIDSCIDCTGPLSPRTRYLRQTKRATGRCKACHENWRKAQNALTRPVHRCRSCEKQLRGPRPSGQCQSCWCAEKNRDPELVARRNEGQRRATANPVRKAMRSIAGRKAKASPEARAKCAEAGRKSAAMPRRPLSAAHRAAISRALRQRHDPPSRPKTFEDQLRAVLEGRAGIISNPILRRAGPDITLGGVSAGML